MESDSKEKISVPSGHFDPLPTHRPLVREDIPAVEEEKKPKPLGVSISDGVKIGGH